MTDSPPADSHLADVTYPVELTPAEIALLRTALRFLRSSLGREEAEEVEAIKTLLAKMPDESTSSGR